MELLNQIKDNFKILFLLPHGVILARKKRKKIKNVEKNQQYLCKILVAHHQKTQFNEKWVKKLLKKKSNTNLDCNKQFPLSKESLP